MGLVFISLGATSIMTSEMGAGAWDAVVVGLANKFGFTPGNWIMIIGFIIMLINAYLTKEKIDFYAFLTNFTIGIFIDAWLFLVFSNVILSSLALQGLLFTFGFLTIVIGAGIYLQADFAPSPVDNLMLSVHKRFRLSMGRARLICEAIALTLALMVSGPIYIGTFIIAFTIGPCIQISIKEINKLYQRLG